jgi:hypothetical protein
MGKSKEKTWLTIGVLLIGVMFLAVGIWRGEPAIVLDKAVALCMECIGIG